MNLAKADTKPAWCPGCGNFGILKAFNAAIEEAHVDRRRLVLVSGIGQAAKLPHYIDGNANVFNGLHGRAIPAATGIKLANHSLEVVVTSGDGDMYGEGGNHLLHAMRRNIGIHCFVHNNQVYGLTKGQASPTSDSGFMTLLQSHGVMSAPFQAMAAAIVADASFVARSFSGDFKHLKAMMIEAMKVDGFALLEILQPCVTFNKVNTFSWYRQRVKPIDPAHDPYDRAGALELAFRWGDEIPIGVYYRSKRPGFESQLPVLKTGTLVS